MGDAVPFRKRPAMRLWEKSKTSHGRHLPDNHGRVTPFRDYPWRIAVRAEKSPQRAAALELLRELGQALPVMGLPETAAETYGTMRAELERKGQMIGNTDLWIAAHAKAAGLTLVTNKEREFRHVPGLKMQNWAL